MLAAQASQFKNELSSAADAVEGLGDMIAGRLPVIGKLSSTLMKAALVVTAAMGAIDAVVVKAASNLETPIQNVATVWDEAGQRVNGTFLSLSDATQQVLDLSTQVPQSAASLAEGLYNVASSGFQGSDALMVLTASAKAASAGLTTTEVSGRAITAVLNSYGLSASSAADVSDTMFQIVNRGVLNFEELSQNMGDIAPLASAAGIAFDDAGSALAAITLAGLPAAEAATSLSGIMRGLVDPSKEMTAQLGELGYESGTAAIEAIGLGGVLEKLRIATGGQSAAWVQLFPDIRAARGAMAATANDGQNLADVTASISDKAERAGATQTALGKQSESLSYQFQILHNTITAIITTFGQALLPVVKVVAGAVQTLVAAVAEIPRPFFVAAAVVTNLVAALVALGAFFLTKWIAAKVFAVAINLATTALTGMGVSAGLLTKTLTGLMLAQSLVTGALAGISIAMVLVGQSAANAKAQAEAMGAALEKGIDLTKPEGVAEALGKISTKGGEVEEQWQKLGYQNPFKRMLAGTIQALTPLANTVDDLSAAHGRLGGEYDNLTVKQVKYDENLNQFAHTSGKTKDEVVALAEAAGVDLAGGFEKTQKALQAAVDKMSPAGVAAAKLKADFDAVAKSIAKTFDPLVAHQKALAADTVAMSASTAAAKRAADETGRVETAALDRRLGNAQAGWDHALALEQRGLEERQKLDDTAEDKRYQAAKDGEDKRYQAAKDDADRTFRSEKETLDRQQRAEKDALDDRLALLDEEYDKRKKAADRLFDAKKDEIQFNIDSTFGAEREGWKQKLTVLEDGHDAELAAIDRAKTDDKRTQTEALDDRQQIGKDGLTDDQKARQQVIDDDHAARQVAIDDEHKQTQDGIDARHKIEQDGFDESTRIRKLAFDDAQTAERQHLADLQKIRGDAADAARQKATTDHVETLAALNGQLKENAAEYDTHTKDVAAIMARGGSDILAEVVQWPPKLVHALATAGPDMFNQVADGIRTTAVTVDPAKIGGPFTEMFKAASIYAAPSVVNGLAMKLASGEIDGTQLQAAVAKLLVPQVIGWQPLPPGIAGPPTPITVTWTYPGGGAAGPPSPTVHKADGGIMRFADGGEYHAAQIAPAGSWRVWAEPETGGEAYIPLAQAKRDRSTSILGQVAEQFGYGLVAMANGGILAGSSAGAGNVEINMPISIEARVSAGVDPDAVGRAIAVHTRRAVDEAIDNLGRQVTMKAWRTR